MKFLRNREVRNQISISLLLTALLAAGGFLVSPACALCLGVGALLLTCVWTLFTRRRYRRLEGLAEEADRILHGERNLDLRQYQEGELSILANELQKMVLRLVEQSDRLMQEKGSLSDSLADISHQLRTPLTSLHLLFSRISGEEDALSRRRLSYEGAQLLNRIDWLVNALLKISRIDAGTAVFVRERVDAGILLDQALEPLRIPMELREQTVIREITGEEMLEDARSGDEARGKDLEPGDREDTGSRENQQDQNAPGFLGDLAWSAEALGNILKNCMEHTPQGGKIWIRALENRLYTEFVIEDNGAGISREDLPHLFERFYKGADSPDSSVGIGLALARMIIREQNGTVKAENRLEGGARFVVRFYKGVI